MSRIETQAEIAYAERTLDGARKWSQKVEKLVWDLEAALSAVEKDRAGYRTRNKANPDGCENASPGEVNDAVRELLKAFPHLRPGEPLDAPAPSRILAGYLVKDAGGTVHGIYKVRGLAAAHKRAARLPGSQVVAEYV